MENWELLAKYLANECSEEEAQEVKKWLEESADHQNDFQKMHKIWEQAEEPVQDFEPNVDQAFQKVQGMIQTPEFDSKVKTIRPVKVDNTIFVSARIAASFILALAVGWGLYWGIKPSNESNLVRLQNNEDFIVTIALPDLTQVVMHPGSEINYPKEFSDEERRVQLAGEAFFRVNEGVRPFIVKTNNTTVQVLGTSFRVRALNQDTLTTVQVVTGRVEFKVDQIPEQKLVLKPGTQATFNEKSAKLDTLEDVDFGPIDWTRGRINFIKTPLSEIIQVLELYYQVDIEVADASLGACSLTTSFRYDEIEGALDLIQKTLNIEYEYQEGIYKLSGTCN